ncbi:MAG: pqq-dependent dehydrogenase, methanol/ethanol family [Phycisphaerales bacterium]|nr:pqq-dependent dehydrogenase, methanol/ethanol family [Phycisphaerales bacterium]
MYRFSKFRAWVGGALGIFLPLLNSTSLSAAEPAGDDGQWTMATKDYGNVRFSGLDQINTQNAKSLKLSWTFSTGVFRGQEAAPLVVGNTMYVVTPFPNYLYALDLNKPGTVKWKYDPKAEAAAKGEACCDWVNRGAAYAEGRIFYNTLDANTVAVDAASGKEIWKTKIGDINKGETITMAPMTVKGKVYVGISGGEFGVRGRLTCVSAADGKILWRAYSCGPDKDCLIGPRFHPFYDSDKGTDLGVKTWPPGHWKIGGGTIWGFLSYDPETNLLFYGMGNPGSWNPDLRPGDNKWSCGCFARDADTGEAVWYYQWSPHDEFDHDGINECMLLELKVDGPDKPARKVLVHPGRTGYMYVLDRATGQVLSADPFTRITASKGVDLKSGRSITNEEKRPRIGKVIRDVQPASPGAKDWQPSAYSPRTGLLYVPHQNLTCDYEAVEANYIAGTPYLGVNERMYAGPGGYRGKFMAWDPVARKEVWGIKENFPVWSGTVVTAGDVAFYGTMDRHFKCVNAKTGEVLWDFETDSGIIGQPVTFKGPDGKQYVAVLAGVGGWAGAIVAGQLDPRDPSAALGFVNAVKDLPDHTKPGDKLYVFALP